MNAARKKRKSPAFDIESAMAIELRRVMIRLNRELDLERKRILMVTSSERGEGKSLFALHFSLILANHMRKRILLVDGDMRRPVQHTVFQVDGSPGLADLLSGDGPDAQAYRTHMDNLDFMPAGVPDENPSMLLQEENIRNVFADLRGDYDLIVLDCPPVVPVSDPLQFASVVDGVVYLVMAGTTSRDLCSRGIEILRSVGANILGVVANNYNDVLPYVYDHKYYGYGDLPGRHSAS